MTMHDLICTACGNVAEYFVWFEGGGCGLLTNTAQCTDCTIKDIAGTHPENAKHGKVTCIKIIDERTPDAI